MLARAADYVTPWLLLAGALTAVAWVALGGMLLRRSVRPHVSRAQGRAGRCVGIALGALVAGGLAGGVGLILVDTICKHYVVPVFWPAVAVVPIVFAIIAILVIYAMFEFPFVQAARITAGAFAIPAVLAAALGGPAAWHAQRSVLTAVARQQSKINLEYLYQAMRIHYRGLLPPKALTDLVAGRIVDARTLKCRNNHGRAVDFFYVPTDKPLTDVPKDEVDKVLACDFIDNHEGEGRTVLFTNGQSQWYDVSQLPGLLDMPQNRRFAEQLRKAEQNLADPYGQDAAGPATWPGAAGR